MTLWKKILIIVTVVMLGSGAVLYFTTRFIVLGGYLRLEDAYMRENAQRAASILDDRLYRMGIILDDWGYWDETCDFVQNTNPDYIEENLGVNSIIALELNWMFFADTSDQTVFSRMADLETETELPIPAALQAYLADEFFSQYHAVTDTFKTVILLPDGPFLLVAHPVLPTSLEGPPCGTMAVGRYLDTDLVDYLAELARVNLRVYRATDPQIPADVRSGLTREQPRLSHVLDAHTIAGYALVSDAQAAPVLILETVAPRDIYQQGQASLRYLIISIGITAVIFGLTALLFLKRAVFGRLFTLSADVAAIGASSDPSRRVTVTGADELTGLERAINGMLTALAQAQAERERAELALREYSEKLKLMVVERTSELQSQYARLDAILANTTDGIIVAAADGTILEMNPVAQTWVSETLSAADADRLRAAVAQMTRQASDQASVLLELAGLDLELNGAHLPPPVEEARATVQFAEPPLPPPAIVIAIHNVSHLKALARMQASFVSNVSHELRTPVTALKLYVDLLRRRPAELERYLLALEQTIDRQMRLVESILSLSRVDIGELELQRTSTDFNTLVKHNLTTQLAQLAEEQNVQLRYEFAGQSLPVSVDTDRIGQAIYDLVINALYYTLPGGAVVISTGAEVRAGRPGVWLSVADTGIGLTEEELPHIWDRFYRGERARQIRAAGSGLGLPLVQEFVNLHQGQVTVSTQPDVGSTFTMWLPGASTLQEM